MNRSEVIKKAKALYAQNQNLSISLLKKIFNVDDKTAKLILRLVNHDLVTSEKSYPITNL